jgi:hypothetical protein
MQISGVSLTLTWPCRLFLLRVLLCTSCCYKLSPFQAHLGRWHCTCFLWPACLFKAHMGHGSSPSPVEFSSHHHFYKLSCPWLLGDAAAPASHRVCLQLTWEVGLPLSPGEFSSLHHSHKLSHFWLLGASPALTGASMARPSLFIYSSGKESPPSSLALGAPHPLCNVSLLFLLLITQFLFFSGVEVGLSRGLCWSGPGLPLGVPHTA